MTRPLGRLVDDLAEAPRPRGLDRLVFFRSSWDREYHDCLQVNGWLLLSAGTGLGTLRGHEVGWQNRGFLTGVHTSREDVRSAEMAR